MCDFSSIDFEADSVYVFDEENEELPSCYEVKIDKIEVVSDDFPTIQQFQDYNLSTETSEKAKTFNQNEIIEVDYRTFQKQPIKKAKVSKVPKKSTEKRIRTRNPDLWKQNIRKKLCEKGLPYTDQNGVLRPGRKIGPTCASSCLLKCSIKITDKEREKIHANFWNLNLEEKRKFYVEFIKENAIKRRSSKCKADNNPKKKKTYHYFFPNGNEKTQVCKKYFVNTLDISEHSFAYYFRNYYGKPNATPKISNRGRKGYPLSVIQEIKKHIQSLPKTEPILSVAQMYNLYKEITKNPVGLEGYRRTYKSLKLIEEKDNSAMKNEAETNRFYDESQEFKTNYRESISIDCESMSNSNEENDIEYDVTYLLDDEEEIDKVKFDEIQNNLSAIIDHKDNETTILQIELVNEVENHEIQNKKANLSKVSNKLLSARNKHTINSKSTMEQQQTNNPKQSKRSEKNLTSKNYKVIGMIDKVCSPSCLYKCPTKITNEERQKIHQYFWKLTKNEQRTFFGKFIKKLKFKYKNKSYIKSHETKRRETFSYFFQVNNQIKQVCKTYFLQTLNISQSIIFDYFMYYHHKVEKSEQSNPLTCSNDKRSRFVNATATHQSLLEEQQTTNISNRKALSKSHLERIKLHISSFPTEPKLSVEQMYKIYQAITDNPVDFCIYRNIYNEIESIKYNAKLVNQSVNNTAENKFYSTVVINEAVKDEIEYLEDIEEFETFEDDSMNNINASIDRAYNTMDEVVTKTEIDFEQYNDGEDESLHSSDELQISGLNKTNNTKTRKCQPELWKQNIRKQLYERGLPFINGKGIERPGRTLGPTCTSTCLYKCTKKIPNEERQKIYEEFWKLSTKEKREFYGNFILKCEVTRRSAACKNSNDPRKKNTFRYNLKVGKNIIQVCKKYFHNTLAISGGTTRNYFEKFHRETEKESEIVKGKITNSLTSSLTSQETVKSKGSTKVRKRSHKILGPTCNSACYHLCSKKISSEKRQQIHEDFWNMTTIEKRHFYSIFVIKSAIKRRRATSGYNNDPKKKNSFSYHLEGDDGQVIQVCKKYFLNTLSIPEKIIFNYFETFDVRNSEEFENDNALDEEEIYFNMTTPSDLCEIRMMSFETKNNELKKRKSESEIKPVFKKLRKIK